MRAFEPAFVHTLATAGFLHSKYMMHVLGNVIILALAGVPLEQRWASDLPSSTSSGCSVGRSDGGVQRRLHHPGPRGVRRCFWPVGGVLPDGPRTKSRSRFSDSPLAHRVHRLALLWSELFEPFPRWNRASPAASPTWRTSAVLWRLMRSFPVARGGPVELGVLDGGPSQEAAASAKRRRLKANMVDLSTLDDPDDRRA